MCIDKHSRHDGRDTAADNAQQSGQFPQICWEWKIIHQPILNTTQLRSTVINDMQSKTVKRQKLQNNTWSDMKIQKYSSI